MFVTCFGLFCDILHVLNPVFCLKLFLLLALYYVLWGKVFEKASFRVCIDLIKYRNKARMRKRQEPYPTTERCQPAGYPSLQCNCIPTSLCDVNEILSDAFPPFGGFLNQFSPLNQEVR